MIVPKETLLFSIVSYGKKTDWKLGLFWVMKQRKKLIILLIRYRIFMAFLALFLVYGGLLKFCFKWSGNLDNERVPLEEVVSSPRTVLLVLFASVLIIGWIIFSNKEKNKSLADRSHRIQSTAIARSASRRCLHNMKRGSDLRVFATVMFWFSVLGLFLVGIIFLLTLTSEEFSKEFLSGEPKAVLVWPAINCLVVAVVSRLILRRRERREGEGEKGSVL